MAQHDKGMLYRSRLMSWKEPTGFQRMQSSRPSRWSRFFGKLKLDGGKKEDVDRPPWLDYEEQDYARNFEQTPNATPQALPTISGLQAREIITVMLKSSGTNKKAGFMLIPRPVDSDVKHEGSPPLWQRRRFHEPSSLKIRIRSPQNGGYDSA